MGYFDGPGATLFRNDVNGVRVFAPFGRRGGVYSIDDAAAARITAAVRRYYQLSLLAVVGTQITVGWRWNAMLVGPLSIAAYVVLLARLVRGLPRASAPFGELPAVSRIEAQTRMASAIGAGRLWGLLAIAMLFVTGGVWMITGGDRMGYFVAGFFGLCGLVYAWQLVLLHRRRQSQHR